MSETLQELKKALLFMRMQQLRNTCKQLNLPFSGIKKALIQRIICFLETGNIVKEEPIPEISKAKKDAVYPFLPETLILYGNYKNDAATRAFMKTLVGNHFHFTAFGIDWIKERWATGKPPSYREFADYWVRENQSRKNQKPPPKEEWAYITFTQAYLEQKPTASHIEIKEAWKAKQREQVFKAEQIIQSLLR